MNRRMALGAMAGAMALAGAIAAPAQAQETLTVVVSYPAGSPPDVVARVVTDRLADRLGRNIVVDARPGGAGNVGTNVVAQSAPDGNTLLVTANGPAAVNQALFPDLPYDPETDLDTVTLFVTAPMILVVDPSLPVEDMAGFIDYARENPGAMSYATTGVGSGVHLTMELLKQREGLDIEHIPYPGSAQAMTDLMGGTIQAMFAIASGALPFIEDDRVRALAITSDERLAAAPDIPTVGEQGHPELVSSVWMGLFAPGGSDRAFLEEVHGHVAEILQDPEVVEIFGNSGYQISGIGLDDFRAFVGEETVKWTGVIEAAGIVLE